MNTRFSGLIVCFFNPVSMGSLYHCNLSLNRFDPLYLFLLKPYFTPLMYISPFRSIKVEFSLKKQSVGQFSKRYLSFLE